MQNRAIASVLDRILKTHIFDYKSLVFIDIILGAGTKPSHGAIYKRRAAHALAPKAARAGKKTSTASAQSLTKLNNLVGLSHVYQAMTADCRRGTRLPMEGNRFLFMKGFFAV
jgi:hypothetical protein